MLAAEVGTPSWLWEPLPLDPLRQPFNGLELSANHPLDRLAQCALPETSPPRLPVSPLEADHHAATLRVLASTACRDCQVREARPPAHCLEHWLWREHEFLIPIRLTMSDVSSPIVVLRAVCSSSDSHDCPCLLCKTSAGYIVVNFDGTIGHRGCHLQNLIPCPIFEDILEIGVSVLQPIVQSLLFFWHWS